MAVYIKDDRNLFDITEVEDNSYLSYEETAEGFKVTNSHVVTVGVIWKSFLSPGKYTISVTSSVHYYTIYNDDTLSEAIQIPKNTSRTINVPNSAKGIRLAGFVGPNSSVIYKIQINKIQQPVNVYIKSDKNLFDISKAEPSSADTVIDIANNSVEFNNSSLYIPLLSGKRYILSFKRNKNANIYLRNGKTSSGYFGQMSSNTTSGVIGVSYTGGGIDYFTMSTFATGLILSDIQIEIAETGTTATPYTPYGYQKVKVLNGFKTLIFNGTENWEAHEIEQNSTPGVYRCVLPLPDVSTFGGDTNANNVICNMYDSVSACDSRYGIKSGASIDADGKFLAILDYNYNTSDISFWKTYLAELYAKGKPLKITYRLKNHIES